MREILWWQQRFPVIDVLISKKDIAEAFRQLLQALADIGLFGADFDGEAWGLPERSLLITVYMVLTFGWTGAPGEWMAWAWLVKILHSRWGPRDPEWEDVVAFHSQFLMDDQIIIEPDLGTRAQQSVECADACTTRVLGPGSRNREKDLEEGALECQKICWGLLYDTRAGTCSLPALKLEKARFLLSDAQLNHGEINIEVKFLESYRGHQNYWAVVQPVMKIVAGATDALLRGTPRGMRYVLPPGGAGDREAVFENFWDATELARVLLADAEKWSIRFTNGFASALTVAERLSLPESRRHCVWLTGDATLEVVATVDWTHRRVAVAPFADYLEALREAAGGATPNDDIIAIGEFLNLVTYLAWAGAEGLLGEAVVVYGGDNMNVQLWVSSWRARPQFARFLLLLMAALRVTYGFELISAYFRTYHNITADSFTRLAAEDQVALRAKHALEQVDLREAWAQHLDRGWVRRALVWKGQAEIDTQLALQLAACRSPPARWKSPTAPRPGRVLHVLEWRGTLGGYCGAAVRGGLSCVDVPGTPGPTTYRWPLAGGRRGLGSDPGWRRCSC